MLAAAGASTPLFRLERLGLAGGGPPALDTVWLLAEIGAPLLEADFTHAALYDELAGRAGVRLQGGSERIRAVVSTQAEQGLLEIRPLTAALAVDRLGHAAGRPVEWRHTLIRVTGSRCSGRSRLIASAGTDTPVMSTVITSRCHGRDRPAPRRTGQLASQIRALASRIGIPRAGGS